MIGERAHRLRSSRRALPGQFAEPSAARRHGVRRPSSLSSPRGIAPSFVAAPSLYRNRPRRAGRRLLGRRRALDRSRSSENVRPRTGGHIRSGEQGDHPGEPVDPAERRELRGTVLGRRRAIRSIGGAPIPGRPLPARRDRRGGPRWKRSGFAHGTAGPKPKATRRPQILIQGSGGRAGGSTAVCDKTTRKKEDEGGFRGGGRKLTTARIFSAGMLAPECALGDQCGH